MTSLYDPENDNGDKHDEALKASGQKYIEDAGAGWDDPEKTSKEMEDDDYRFLNRWDKK